MNFCELIIYKKKGIEYRTQRGKRVNEQELIALKEGTTLDSAEVTSTITDVTIKIMECSSHSK